jgi:hypothetical protein
VIARAGGGEVRDRDGLVRARFSAGVGPDGLELFVPWTALGMSRWPVGLRLTPALFCATSGAPIAPRDGAASAVIDALTDYGGPDVAPRDTRSEVLDGAIDHAFSMRFGISGTLNEGLHVRRLAPLASLVRGGPWIELQNLSDEPIALDRFAIGDEAIPGGPDGLLELPPGRAVMPGARVTIALDGAAFRAAFATGADVELLGTDPATPDAIPRTDRGRGAVRFDPAGDEVALFDESRTLLDVVTYNAGSYPLIPAYPGLARDAVLTRSPTGLDIDDNRLDFYRLGSVCRDLGDCDDPQCGTCSERACGERPDGLTCAIDGCPAGRCVAGRCAPRPDAGTCSADAHADDASIDGRGTDASDERTTDATLADRPDAPPPREEDAGPEARDAEPPPDRLDGPDDGASGPDGTAERDGAMDARGAETEPDGSPGEGSLAPRGPDARALDSGFADDHARTSGAGCACAAGAGAARGPLGWGLWAALGGAIGAQRRRRRPAPN